MEDFEEILDGGDTGSNAVSASKKDQNKSKTSVKKEKQIQFAAISGAYIRKRWLCVRESITGTVAQIDAAYSYLSLRICCS